MARRPGEPDEPAGTASEEGARGAARRPFELGRARRAAIDTLVAYRAARDPAALVGVFQALADDLPAHWLVAGLLSVSSQLVDYLSASEKLDPDEVLAALASLEVEDELAGLQGGQEDDETAAWAHEDAVADEQAAESFPASDPPARWSGPPDPPDPRDRPGGAGGPGGGRARPLG